MNGFQKTISGVLFSILLSIPVCAAQLTAHQDTFWGRSSPWAQKRLADILINFERLDDALGLIEGALNNAGPLLTAINVGALPPPLNVPSGVPLTDIQTVTAAIQNPSPDLGSAVTAVVNLTDSVSLNPTAPHTNLYADLIAVKNVIGPGATLAQALNADLLLMGLLVSTGNINGDLLSLRASLGPIPTTLQANLTVDLLYINTFALPLNPVSSGVIYTDLVTVKGRINNSPLVLDLGSSVTAEIGYINTPALPGGPASLGIIDGDLQTLLSKIYPLGGTLGNAVNLTYLSIGVPSLLPIIGSSGNIMGDIQIMTSRIVLGAPNLGNAIMQILNRIYPGSADLTSAVDSTLTLIGTSAVGVPSSLVIRNDIQALIGNIFFGQPSLGAAIVAYRQSLCTLIGLAALINPPVASTGNPTQDILLMIPQIYSLGGPSIGFAVQMIRNQTIANVTLIGTGNLNPGPVAPVDIPTDIGVILSRMTNPAQANLGSAVTTIIGLIGAPPILVPPYNVIGTDLGLALTAINPLAGNLFAAINADLLLIGTPNLVPVPIPTNQISGEIATLISRIYVPAGNGGTAVTSVINSIGTANLVPVPLATNVIGGEIATLISRIYIPAGNGGAAVTSVINSIGTANLVPLPLATNVIGGEITTLISRIHPPAPNAGNAVMAVLNNISTASLPGGTPSSGIITQDVDTAKNKIDPGSGTLGASVMAVNNLLDPLNVGDLIAEVTGLLALLNQISTDGIVIPAASPVSVSIRQWITNRGY